MENMQASKMVVLGGTNVFIIVIGPLSGLFNGHIAHATRRRRKISCSLLLAIIQLRSVPSSMGYNWLV